MKKSFTILVALLVVAVSCNKNGDVAPATIEPAINTARGTTIGAAVATTITAAGGVASLPALGVKVTVPAGAMATGSQLSIQQVSNVLNAEEKAMRISGDWTKPITLEYQSPDADPASHNVFVSMGSLWVGARKPKVSGNAILVRLGANAGTTVKNGRVTAKTYDLAFAKVFTIKPATSSLDLSKTQQFMAYAKQGFVPQKDINGNYITDEAKYEAYQEAIRQSGIEDAPTTKPTVDDDEDLAPLAPPKYPDANEKLAPLAIVAKEYPFSNIKEGFKRYWTVQGVGGQVGTINNSGLYTAPTDAASKGKTATVYFYSENIKTNESLLANAKVRIKDGKTRYVGTCSMTVEKFNFNGKYNVCNPNEVYTTSAKVSFVKKFDDEWQIEPLETEFTLQQFTTDFPYSATSYKNTKITPVTPAPSQKTTGSILFLNGKLYFYVAAYAGQLTMETTQKANAASPEVKTSGLTENNAVLYIYNSIDQKNLPSLPSDLKVLQGTHTYSTVSTECDKLTTTITAKWSFTLVE